MNARDTAPLRTKIAAHLDAVQEGSAAKIGRAVGMADYPSVVIKELNAMRTDGLVECEQRKKENIYWLAVPLEQVMALDCGAGADPAAPDAVLPAGVRAGGRGAQILGVLTDEPMAARNIASALKCARGQIDPILTHLYKQGHVRRQKMADGAYGYMRATNQESPAGGGCNNTGSSASDDSQSATAEGATVHQEPAPMSSATPTAASVAGDVKGGGQTDTPLTDDRPTAVHGPEFIKDLTEDEDVWRAPELQYLAAEDYIMPPADPVLLAKANRMLSERLARVAHVLRGCGLPALAEIGCGEDLQMATAALSGAFQVKQAELEYERAVSGAACSSLAAVARDLGLPPDAGGHQPIINAIDAIRGERDDNYEQAIDTLRRERDDVVSQYGLLKVRHDDYEQAIAEIHRACSDAGITVGHVAERVRKLAEHLESLRTATTALADEAVDVLQAAKGYIMTASKRKPRRITKPEAARDAALSAIRSGAQCARVFALIPIGEARRGAEWRDA